ncbi:MAG: acyl-CoA thioesterase [Pseudomonadota bacterium]
MYPVFRLIWQFWLHRNAPSLPVTGTHVSHHLCLPWDLDLWMELNNGRTLTLYDMGRMPMARRIGLIAALRRRKWGLTMAGAHVRYRRRVRIWDRIEMRTGCVGWDDRFAYIAQSMWVRGECTSHILYRSAVTGKDGIVPPAAVMAEIGAEGPPPPLPDWVAAWIEADARRPWPPDDTVPQGHVPPAP